MAAILPSQVPVGTITGTMQFVDEDSWDVDTDPELIVVSGTVTFTASVRTLRMPTFQTILVPLRFDCTFDNQGNLIPKDGNGLGVKLPATNSPLISEQDYTWRVEFNLREVATGFTVRLDSFNIQVPVGSTRDLSDLIPVSESPGTITIQGPPGAAGLNGSNVLPTDTAIANAIQTPGTQTEEALNTKIGTATAGKQDIATLGTAIATNIQTPGTETEAALNAAVLGLIEENVIPTTAPGVTFITLTTTAQAITISEDSVVGLALVQGSGGNRTASWPLGIRWAGGTTPTLSTAEGAIDVVTLVADGAGGWLGKLDERYPSTLVPLVQIFLDSFTRADGTLWASGRTADTGQTWAGGTLNANISANQLQPGPSTLIYATIAAGWGNIFKFNYDIKAPTSGDVKVSVRGPASTTLSGALANLIASGIISFGGGAITPATTTFNNGNGTEPGGQLKNYTPIPGFVAAGTYAVEGEVNMTTGKFIIRVNGTRLLEATYSPAQLTTLAGYNSVQVIGYNTARVDNLKVSA